MDPRTKQIILIAALSMIITLALVAVIVEIFLISGEKSLLVSMLNNTVNGKTSGIAFVGGGPTAIWVLSVIFILIIFRSIPPPAKLKTTLHLHFKEEDDEVPVTLDQFNKANCTYKIYKSGENKPEKTIGRRVDTQHGPHIEVEPNGIEDPEYMVELKYNNLTWTCEYCYSPKKGEVSMIRNR